MEGIIFEITIILISFCFLSTNNRVYSLPTVSAPKLINNSTIITPTENITTNSTTTTTSSTTIIINSGVDSNSSSNNNKNIDVQWLPLAIFFIVIFALCYWLCCNSKLCCDCPEFNHRSDENGRYGTCRPAMRKDRFQATCGYPHAPNVDQHQKYCGPNRLHRYKEPNVAIVDDNDKIIEDTYTLTNSYLNTADSKDEMRMFKHDLEEKRRLHQQRTEMINSLSRTRQMSAISESREPAPVYTSRENIFKMWKEAGALKENDNDAWSIHAPSISEESISKSCGSKKVVVDKHSRSSSSIIRNSLNDSQESVVNLLNDNNNNSNTCNSVHSINSMVKIASGRNSIVVTEDLDKKLDEQIVVVPYEQIIKEQNNNNKGSDGQR